MSRLWILALALLATGPALAQTPQAGPVPAPAPAPDPAQQRAQAAFEALPETERRQIQLDLGFATTFSGAALGTFGPLTYRAIQRFEQEAKLKADGVLDAPERATLAAAAKREREKFGFRQISDPVTKASIGLPLALLPKVEPQPGGTRWQSADGKVTVVTRAPQVTEGTLEELYEKAQVSSNPQRKVTYKLLRPEFYVIAGETPQGKFYQRMAKLPDGALRGFAVSYDKAQATLWDRLTVAAANTYSPAGAAASAVAGAAAAAAGGPARVVAPAADPFAPRVFARTLSGVVVAPGRVLTAAAALKACPQAAIAGRPVRALAEEAGVVLVAADALAAPALVAALAPSIVTGPASVLTQGTVGDGTRGLLALPADVEGIALSAALQPGAAGAPVFAADGVLIGLVTSDPSARLQIAGVVLAARHQMTGAEGIDRLLKAQGVTLAPPQGAPVRGMGATASRHGRAVVAITCGP